MTDGPDRNDLDRQQESLGARREAAGTSFGTSRRGQPVGPTIQISPKLAGCGCFGCSSLVVLVGGVGLLWIVGLYLLPDWRASRYVPNSCLVLDRKVESQVFDVLGPANQGPKKQEAYRPAIKIQYEVNGRKIEAWTYDASRIYSPDRAAQQAIVDSFQVGSTYPCWYDPDRPDQAVLVRGHSWGAYVFLILPIALLTVGGLGIALARTIATSEPRPVAPGGIPPNAPRVPRVIQALQTLAARRPGEFDPAQFGDPLAMKIEWSPLTAGGSSFRAHRLVEVDPDRLAFRATRRAILFALCVLLAGMGVLILMFSQIVSSFLSGRMNFNMFMAFLTALLFCAVGGYLLRSFTTPIVFDRQMGLFWKGRKAPDEFSDLDSLKNVANFKEIHALQLIAYYGGKYTSYEMNLVMTNAERLNVVVYSGGHRNIFRNDAAIVAEFLGKPVWDAV